ncbi:MAG: hypothetical protein WCW52_08340 [Elusimicrobiales bacterium]|jgi:hypothetical protein
MKKGLLAIIGMLLISGCSHRSMPTEGMAKAYLQRRIRGNVLEFKKINGVKNAGEYLLLYTTKVQCEKGQRITEDNYLSECAAGETRTWAGKILFIYSENGWMPVANIREGEGMF